MSNLNQLTATRNECEQVVKLGIVPNCFLAWVKDVPEKEPKEGDQPTYSVLPMGDLMPGENFIPAWTKAELDVMIGPNFSPKPDLFTPQQLGNYKLAKAESYPVYFVDKMVVRENGASASAIALIFLLEEGHVKAVEANYRYSKVFKPFKQ